MTKINCFGIIGGDKRQLYMANSLQKHGYQVCLTGFEKMRQEIFPKEQMLTLEELLRVSDALILSLPSTRDGKTLNTPFANYEILLNDLFALKVKSKPIFCSMKEKILKTSDKFQSENLYDYFEREELTVLNAVPTAYI